jgi:hypothetical protein
MDILIVILNLKPQFDISRLPFIVVRVAKILVLKSHENQSGCVMAVFLLQLLNNTIFLKTPFSSR